MHGTSFNIQILNIPVVFLRVHEITKFSAQHNQKLTHSEVLYDCIYEVWRQSCERLSWKWKENQQGKSEGFESCDRPIVRKRPIWVKIGDVLSRVTFKFDECPWKTIGHLFFAVSSFVQHFIAIGEFTLELQSGNAQFESNSMIFRAMWPWNLTDDLEK